MSDRELLEAAAKAAGIQHGGWREGWLQRNGLYTPPNESLWNPLTDDGDALRLAVSLEFDVQPFGAWMGDELDEAAALVMNKLGRSTYEAHNGDPLAATRRAIVKGAAALAKGTAEG